jgi:signal transduction histidine kinase
MQRHKDRIRPWIPLVILVAGMMLTIWLWRSLVQEERAQMRRATAQEAATVRNAIGNRMLSRVRALIRLAKRVEFSGEPNSEMWQSNTNLLEQHLPGFAAVVWVDPSMRMRLVAPKEGNEHRLGTDLAALPRQVEAFKRAKNDKEPTVSPIDRTDQGKLAFAVHVPAFRNGKFMGEVMGIFRASDIFDAILNTLETEESALRGYSFAIYSGGQEVYSHIRGGRELEERWSQSATFDIQGTHWVLKVWPSKTLYGQLRTLLPQTALAGGAATSLLLALAVHLALLARWHGRRTEEANVHMRQEIDERHRAEEALREMTGQLERSNRELQDFASVASHDLQEPLRKIQAFGDRLTAKCGPQLGVEGRDYLQRMHGAAGRMRRLIEDLLTFSRVTTRALPFEQVDLSRIAADVLDDLETRIEQSQAKVEVDPLPILQADPLQMRQLIQNLISNGLKFQKPDRPPQVRVSAEIVQEEKPDAAPMAMCRLSVKDDGIGFDERYLDRIFTVFQRLHSRTEYAGTGVGLAICRKIAERHGGSITARSVPGQGAEFIVLLPLKQPATESDGHEQQTDGNGQGDYNSSGG